jgi:hypothetical protein
MKIDIYKSVKNGTKYISVPANADIEKMAFPASLDTDLLSLSPFKTALDIQPGDGRVALNSADIIDQINKNGYATHTATVTVTIKRGAP